MKRSKTQIQVVGVSGLHMTRHSEIRCQQRGVPDKVLTAHLNNADLEIPRGSGCTLLMMSKIRISELGPRTPEGVSTDRLGNLGVLMKGIMAITVVRVHDPSFMRSTLSRRRKAPKRISRRRNPRTGQILGIRT